MLNLTKKIHNFSYQKGLFWQKQKIVVGVSGGADSVCLLNVLLELRKKYDFSLHIAHVNYNLRGEDSKKDQVFVEKLAKEKGIDLSVLSLKKIKKISNLENELRKIRYDFFEKTRKKLHFDSIAVAHNQDDQAETVLLRILRGSGLQGLSSMMAESGRVIRPLLGTSRKEIMLYIGQKNLSFRTDKTNLFPIYSRNKVRLELIPYLEKKFNPNVKEVLARLAESIGNDYAYIAKEGRNKLKKTKNNEGVFFSSAKFLRLHPAMQKEALRSVIRSVKGDLIDVDAGNIEEMIKLLKSNKNKTQKTSFKGLKIEKRGDIVSILHSNKF